MCSIPQVYSRIFYACWCNVRTRSIMSTEFTELLVLRMTVDSQYDAMRGPGMQGHPNF